MRERYARFLRERDRQEHAAIGALLAFVLRPADNCVDLGASNGDILAEMVRLAPSGRHVACEPIPALAERLTRAFPSVEVHPRAVADRAGRASFYHVIDEPPLSSLRQLPYFEGHRFERIEVEVTDLDSLLPESYAPAVIKLDVEGAEVQALRGALRTIHRHRPLLIIEFTRDGAGAFEAGPDDLYDLVCEVAGMRLFDVFGRGPYDRAGLRTAFHARRVLNYVAHP
jgi:FkbM family methyltransferase